MKLAARLATVALLALAVCAPAEACDCPHETPARALARADAVFEARVLSIGPSRFRGQPCGGFCPDTAVRMQVIRHWKGAPAREVVVLTDLQSDCGYELIAGETYLVYAGRSGDSYHTDICRRTTPMSRAAEDLRALGAGTAIAR